MTKRALLRKLIHEARAILSESASIVEGAPMPTVREQRMADLILLVEAAGRQERLERFKRMDLNRSRRASVARRMKSNTTGHT